MIADRVKETTTTTGTGTVDLDGADTAFQTFVAGIGDGETAYYCIQSLSSGEWEVGVGTVTDASPDTLSRTTVLQSSNADALVNFSAGTKDVFIALPADKTIYRDANGNVGIGTPSPVATLDVNGGFAANLVTKTGAYTATTSDHVILCDASGGAFTVTLPAASSVTGIIYHIKKTDSSSSAVTINGNSTETIDGDQTIDLKLQYESVMIASDGSNWHII